MSRGFRDADRDLEEAVRQALVYDNRLSSQPIHVSARDGIVDLSGAVQFDGRAVAAYEVAATVPGVRKVLKHLKVTPPEERPDEKIADAIRRALDARPDVIKEAITVSVSAGVATLAGSVGDAWQHAIAEDVARSAHGVREVRNRLIIDFGQQVDDEEVGYEIQSAICHACGLNRDAIKVAVNKRAVVLSGQVATPSLKEHVERVANRYGVLNVRNEIEIGPLPRT